MHSRKYGVSGLGIIFAAALSTAACQSPDEGAPMQMGSQPPGGSDQPPTSQPTTVTVTLEGALIGPGKVDHSTWDFSLSGVPDNVWSALANALVGTNPYAKVLSIMVGPLTASLAPPDPWGKVEVDGTGGTRMAQWLAPENEAIQDTFTPLWTHRPAWQGVRLDQDIRFTVQLWDADFNATDPIGIASINTNDLSAALSAKKVYHVNVADQTRNTILFLDITVTAD